MRVKNATWFEVRIKRERINDKGQSEDVTEIYMVEALSFTEAEYRTFKELAPSTKGELVVKNINPSPYQDVVFAEKEENMKWWKVKIEYIYTDERSEKEKRAKTVTLIQAANPSAAIKMAEAYLSGTMLDYEISNVDITGVIGILELKSGEKHEKKRIPD